MRSDSAYNFEIITTDIRDALSIAPSRIGGIGDSSSVVSRLRTTQSSVKPSFNRPWTSAGGAQSAINNDELTVASTSMSALIASRKGARATSNGKNSKSPTEVAKRLESQIERLIEQTVLLRKEGKLEEALESAKEASKKEHLLRKHVKANSISNNSEDELTYSAWFNLASTYEANDMPDEAIKTYTYLAKQSQTYHQSSRARIQMGNVYYSSRNYASAIKMYKMALDMTFRKDDKAVAHKIQRNIGNSYFHLGKILDAVKNYEEAMAAAPDYQTGFNLLVCHLALGDVDSMKKDFTTLVNIPLEEDDVNGISPEEDMLLGETKEPETKPEVNERTKEANHFILSAARLIAPKLDSDDLSAGYDWVYSALEDRHEDLAIKIKLEQATQKLKGNEVAAATKMMKHLQKKNKKAKAATSTNLSFVSFLEGNIDKASKYADIALESDRYNPMALVNKGNCAFMNGDCEKAKDLYLEAIGVQADCVQAIYNLGLANAQLGFAEEAIHAFEKVHRITPNNPQIIHQIADIYDLQGRSEDAIKWFSVLTARVPSDPANLAKLGQLYAETKDESQGLHFSLESFRHFPVDLDVISWIGTWFVQQEMFERSIYFFQQARQTNPKEIKWGFMIASAHKRCGFDDRAFDTYNQLHKEFPANIECLRHLIQACDAMGKSSYEYAAKREALLG